MSSWIFHQPKFEYQSILNHQLDAFGWLGHTDFAYDLISQYQPETVVELGTHWGVSFFSFCQAAKDHSLATKLYAVDTWQGEEHAGLYDEKVIRLVKKIREEYFPSLQISLVRKTFDEARHDFENHSIDILHIDGLHTYEAVKHDFESWLPKLKKNGLVLVHDIAETGRGFGVHKFWRELTKKYPHHIELPHSHGLGLLCFNNNFWQAIEPLRETWLAYYGLAHQKETLSKDLFWASRELNIARAKLIELDQTVQKNKLLTTQVRETAQHARNLQAMLDDIHSSKAYKLARGLGNWRQIIKRKR